MNNTQNKFLGDRKLARKFTLRPPNFGQSANLENLFFCKPGITILSPVSVNPFLIFRTRYPAKIVYGIIFSITIFVMDLMLVFWTWAEKSKGYKFVYRYGPTLLLFAEMHLGIPRPNLAVLKDASSLRACACSCTPDSAFIRGFIKTFVSWNWFPNLFAFHESQCNLVSSLVKEEFYNA